MKKYLKILFFIVVPFGWLFYILINKRFRRVLIGKAAKFFHTLFQPSNL